MRQASLLGWYESDEDMPFQMALDGKALELADELGRPPANVPRYTLTIPREDAERLATLCEHAPDLPAEVKEWQILFETLYVFRR